MERKAIALLMASAVCLSYVAGFAAAADADDLDRFQIQGSVYCDTCRVQFITRLSKFLQGAKVRLECKNRVNGTLTVSKEAVTDESGSFLMEVTGDHEEEVCEIVLVESPDKDCSEVSKEAFLRNAAKISLTANDGIVSNETRIVNPLGFMVKTPSTECPAAFKELGIKPDVIF
ncbi:PREDICTED: pollen-specific protein-like At4g18596 [Tarenaya hassleriana]|uniref:pollen-specific protein-like At4g18596 n=1 Tax=Tarenaya hassleriana TaxID=28532 RepID=UPI00053C191E|nr:PREDICTED: pollen-specific protein-like At4g18596 [Tarenaya hassleriana]